MSTDQKILGTAPEQIEEDSKKTSTKAFQIFLTDLEKLTSAEEKLRAVISFMRQALSQSGTPHFKDFWDARQMALLLFKEINNPIFRSQLWGQYLELSAEARSLKDILDEHSMFAIEQIDLAIQSLEKDIENYALLLEQIPPINFPMLAQVSEEKLNVFHNTQQELDLLNNFALRVNSLRKEVLKTEMRIRYKNKFFERLSIIGDKVFPKRKELIAQVSDMFSQEVQEFAQVHFSDLEATVVPGFQLRDSIKGLQELAKILTLNAQSFSDSRLQLSHAWDTLKVFEKERKKQHAQKRAEFRENYDLIGQKINELGAYCVSAEADEAQARKHSDEILEFMRTVMLSREDVRELKQELYNAKAPLLQRAQIEAEAKERSFQEEQNKIREQSLTLRKELEALLQDAESLTVDALTAKREMYQQQYDRLSLSKAEKQIFERLFKQTRDLLVDKKEKVVLLRSEGDQQNIENLRSIYQQRKERRQAIKTQLEQYRKALGCSGLDFEKAMLLRELIDTEKLQLEKMNQAIGEVEEKLSALEE